MSGFIQGEDRFQATLFPERIDDYVAEDSSVRVIDILTNSPPHHEFFVYIKDEYRKACPFEPESFVDRKACVYGKIAKDNGLRQVIALVRTIQFSVEGIGMDGN